MSSLSPAALSEKTTILASSFYCYEKRTSVKLLWLKGGMIVETFSFSVSNSSINAYSLSSSQTTSPLVLTWVSPITQILLSAAWHRNVRAALKVSLLFSLLQFLKTSNTNSSIYAKLICHPHNERTFLFYVQSVNSDHICGCLIFPTIISFMAFFLIFENELQLNLWPLNYWETLERSLTVCTMLSTVCNEI